MASANVARRRADSNRWNIPVAHPGWVYVVETERGVKIGWTQHPEQRLRTYGDDSYVWAIEEGTRADESAILRRWSHLSIGGEWLRTTEELLTAAEDGTIFPRRGLCRFAR